MTERVTGLRDDLEALLAAPVLTGHDDPLERVRACADIQSRAGDLLTSAVHRARDDGRTWREIGTTLGISRQAAFQRFGTPVDPRTGDVMNTTALPEAAGLAATIIDDLAHARWGAVVDRFDATVAEKLNAGGLAAAWAQVIGMAGAFESHGQVEAVRAADMTITNTPLSFEAGDFIARITFRDDRTIAGLYILPPEHPK